MLRSVLAISAPQVLELAREPRRPELRLGESLLVVTLRSRRRRELHDRVRIESSVALACDHHERVGSPAALAELRIDVHARRLVRVSKLDEGHAEERELRDHSHALKFRRDEIEELVVVEGAHAIVARDLRASGRDDRHAVLPDHAAQTADQTGRVPEEAEVGDDGEVYLSNGDVLVRIGVHAHASWRALHFRARTSEIRIPDLNFVGALLHEALCQSE